MGMTEIIEFVMKSDIIESRAQLFGVEKRRARNFKISFLRYLAK